MNFMVYTRGSAADYERWAELVGSSEWAWEKTKARFQRLECFSSDVAPELEQYTRPDPLTYGKNGYLHPSTACQKGSC